MSLVIVLIPLLCSFMLVLIPFVIPSVFPLFKFCVWSFCLHSLPCVFSPFHTCTACSLCMYIVNSWCHLQRDTDKLFDSVCVSLSSFVSVSVSSFTEFCFCVYPPFLPLFVLLHIYPYPLHSPLIYVFLFSCWSFSSSIFPL